MSIINCTFDFYLFNLKNLIPVLEKGDLIYITAPAKAIDIRPIAYARDFLENQGFQVLISKNCLGQHHYFSGTDEERLKDLQYGIDNPEVKAILCARGGYGCIRILDGINWAAMLREPKWLIGFSDITIFHQRLLRFDLPSIHATMPLNFENNSDEALNSLLSALSGLDCSISTIPNKNNKSGSARGKLVGGNLSVLQSLLGTDDQIDYSNTILFLEDVSEYLYKIDRMFYSFEKAGVFNKIKGLIIGGMTDLKDSDIPFGQTIEQIILNHFIFHNIPIAFGFPAGHIDDNRALILGADCQLVVNDFEVSLSYV